MKLNIKKTISVGLAFFTICIFWEAYDNLMPLFLGNFDLPKTVIGVIMALDNILALVMLPFMGILSDHTKSRFGRRIPFIVAGSALAAGTLLLINYAHNAHLLWLLILSTVFLLIFMCIYRTPAVSLMPDVTPKPLRSKANAVINIMGLIGGVVFLVLSMTPLYQVIKDVDGNITGIQTGNWWLIGVVSVLMVAAALTMFFRVKELKLVEEREQAEKEAGIFEEPEPAAATQQKTGLWTRFKRNFGNLDKGQRKSLIFLMLSVFLWFFGYNAAKTWFSTIALDIFPDGKFAMPLLVANVAGFLMYIPSSIIGGKIGRKKTVMLGLLIMLTGFVLATIFVFVIKNASVFNILFILVFIFVGAGWATLNVHSYVMSVEMADKSNTGFFTGLYYTFSMGAQALTPVLSGLLMDSVGITSVFPYAVVFVALSVLTMCFVNHGNAKAIDNRSMLERLDVDD